MAKRIIDTVCPRVAKFVIDLAFMMQGEEEDELPERLIGTVRLIRLDLAGPSSKVSHQNRGGGIARDRIPRYESRTLIEHPACK